MVSKPIFTHLNSDEDREFYRRERTYLIESGLQDLDEQLGCQDPEFDIAYSRYLHARGTPIEARSARGIYPIVIPEATLTHLRNSFSNKGKGESALGQSPKGNARGKAFKAQPQAAIRSPGTGQLCSIHPFLGSTPFLLTWLCWSDW